MSVAIDGADNSFVQEFVKGFLTTAFVGLAALMAAFYMGGFNPTELNHPSHQIVDGAALLILFAPAIWACAHFRQKRRRCYGVFAGYLPILLALFGLILLCLGAMRGTITG